jgi:hypothetical protein
MGITITGGLTFGNGLAVSSPPPVTNYFLGKVASPGADSLQGAGVGMDITNDNVYLTGGIPFVNTGNSPFISIAANGTVNTQLRSLIDGGNYNNQYNSSMFTDTDGSIYMAGYASYFGSNILIMYKYNSSGTIAWIRSIQPDVNAVSDGYPPRITGDSSRIYVCANFGNFVGALACSKTDGAYSWFTQLDGGASLLTATGITASNGTVYIVGSNFFSGKTFNVGLDGFDGTIGTQYEFTGSNSVYNPSITSDTNFQYISMIDQNTGALILIAFNFGFFGSSTSISASVSGGTISYITRDSSGNLYIFTKTSTGELLLLKYNSSLALQWQQVLTTQTFFVTPGGVAVDTTGAKTAFAINASMSGGSSGGVDFGPGMIFARLPIDGSGSTTQTVGDTNFVYAASSYSTGTPSISASSSSYTQSTPTVYANDTLTATNSTTTLTINDYNF